MKQLLIISVLALAGCMADGETPGQDQSTADPAVFNGPAVDRAWRRLVACVNGEYGGQTAPDVLVFDAVVVRGPDGALSSAAYWPDSETVEVAIGDLIAPMSGDDSDIGVGFRSALADHLRTMQTVPDDACIKRP